MRATTSKKRTRRKSPKSQLYANLARVGIWRVVIEYDGCGDSGCIADITLYDADDKVITMPETQVAYTTEASGFNYKTNRPSTPRKTCTGPLREAIETWCYDLLELHFAGWEDNEGADGSIELNVPLNTASWEHNRRFTDTSTEQLGV